MVSLAVVLALALTACQDNRATVFNPSSKLTEEFTEEVRFIREWNALLYFHIKHLVVGPPEASRLYGYLGVTTYEALIGGMPDNHSLVGQLNELEELPRTDPDLEYDWPTVLTESLFQVCTDLLSFTLQDEDGTFTKLRDSQLAERSAVVAEDVHERSREYGKELSNALIDWIANDNYVETRKLFYKTPSRTGHPERWEPTDINVTALEPHWNQIRPFAIDSSNVCPAELDYEYSEEKTSKFYEQAMMVFNADLNLTEEQRNDALYWADCPGETATPPGHWSFIMGYASQEQGLNLKEAAEMYALAGIGIADAFIQCWHTKYAFNMVRPKTYIREVMGVADWEPYVVTPPFPEYTSGHSVVSSCAAELLTSFFGEEMGFTDSTHVRIGLAPRRFESFRAAAQQAVNSRLYGGMHYPMANEQGRNQGICLANKILDKIKLRHEDNTL